MVSALLFFPFTFLYFSAAADLQKYSNMDQRFVNYF